MGHPLTQAQVADLLEQTKRPIKQLQDAVDDLSDQLVILNSEQQRLVHENAKTGQLTLPT